MKDLSYVNGNSVSHEKEVEQIIHSINCLKEKLKVFEYGPEISRKSVQGNSYCPSELPSRDEQEVVTSSQHMHKLPGQKHPNSIRKLSHILKSKSQSKTKDMSTIGKDVEKQESVISISNKVKYQPLNSLSKNTEKCEMLFTNLSELREIAVNLHSKLETLVENTHELCNAQSVISFDKRQSINGEANLQTIHHNLEEKIATIHTLLEENNQEHSTMIKLLEKIDKNIFALTNLLEMLRLRKSGAKSGQTASQQINKQSMKYEHIVMPQVSKISAKSECRNSQMSKIYEKPEHVICNTSAFLENELIQCLCCEYSETNNEKNNKSFQGKLNKLYDDEKQKRRESEFILIPTNENNKIKSQSNKTSPLVYEQQYSRNPNAKEFPHPPKTWISRSGINGTPSNLEPVTIVHEPIITRSIDYNSKSSLLMPKEINADMNPAEKGPVNYLEVTPAPAEINSKYSHKQNDHNKKQQKRNSCFSFCIKNRKTENKKK